MKTQREVREIDEYVYKLRNAINGSKNRKEWYKRSWYVSSFYKFMITCLQQLKKEKDV